MSNTGSNDRDILDSDGKLSIKSNMNDWHPTSKIDVLFDLINVRDGNLNCDVFFMLSSQSAQLNPYLLHIRSIMSKKNKRLDLSLV